MGIRLNLILKKIKSYYYILIYFNNFKRVGGKSTLEKPLKINGQRSIEIGNKVFIAKYVWLSTLKINNQQKPLLRIGNGSRIGHFNHIFATRSIIIEDNVMTADKVYISDNSHSYEDINIPIMLQPVIQLNDVIIGSGTWIGENVCIIGCKIGRNCVIGANSIVKEDIPDFCVVVGNPARVIKYYDNSKKRWIRI